MYEDSHLEADYDDRYGAPDPLDDWPILNYSDVLDREDEWDRRNQEDPEDPEDYTGESDIPDEPIGIATFESYPNEADEYHRSLQVSQFGYLI